MNKRDGIILGLLVSIFLLWAVLFWALVRAEGELLAEPILTRVTAPPPSCWVTSSHKTLRADGGWMWVQVCPRGTRPSTRSLLLP